MEPRVADGVPGGADPRGRRLHRLRRRRLLAHSRARCGPDEIRAFHNSCLHRGTRLRTSPVAVTELRCPFHGFTWNLDGTLRGMPCPWDFPHVDTGQILPPRGPGGDVGRVRLREPGPAERRPLEDVPRDPALSISPRGPSQDRHLAAHVVRVVPCNWKVALEAFIESYHTVAVHPQLLKTSGRHPDRVRRLPGVRHVSRMITPVGVASEHTASEVGEQDIVDAMFLTRDDPDAVVPDGGTARQVPGRPQRAPAGARARAATTPPSPTARRSTPSSTSSSPTSCPGPGTPRPSPTGSGPSDRRPRLRVMDVMLLEPVPEARPAPAGRAHPPPRSTGRRWADAPELGYLGRILNQDTATLARVQRGLEASPGPDVTLARYQESRIRHFHAHPRRVPRGVTGRAPPGGRLRRTGRPPPTNRCSTPPWPTSCARRPTLPHTHRPRARVPPSPTGGAAGPTGSSRPRPRARHWRWRPGSVPANGWRSVAPSIPESLDPHLRRGHGRRRPGAREPGPARRRAGPHPRSVGSRRRLPGPRVPGSRSGRHPRLDQAASFRSCATSWSLTLGRVPAREASPTSDTALRRRTPHATRTGTVDLTTRTPRRGTWPSSCTPRGRPACPRGRFSPTGA